MNISSDKPFTKAIMTFSWTPENKLFSKNYVNYHMYKMLENKVYIYICQGLNMLMMTCQFVQTVLQVLLLLEMNIHVTPKVAYLQLHNFNDSKQWLPLAATLFC